MERDLEHGLNCETAAWEEPNCPYKGRKTTGAFTGSRTSAGEGLAGWPMAWTSQTATCGGLEGLGRPEEGGRRAEVARGGRMTAWKGRTRWTTAWKGRARSDGGLDGRTVAGDGLERPDRPGKRSEGLDGGGMGGQRD